MKKLLYLLVAGTLFIFTACNCGGDATATEEVAVEEVAVEEVAVEEVAAEEVVDTTVVEEAETTEE